MDNLVQCFTSKKYSGGPKIGRCYFKVCQPLWYLMAETVLHFYVLSLPVHFSLEQYWGFVSGS